MTKKTNTEKKINRWFFVFELSKYVKNYKLKFFIGVLINILYKILPVAISFLISYMVAAGVTGEIYEVKHFFIATVILICFVAIFYYLDIFIFHDIAYQVLTDLRNKAYEMIDKIAPGGMDGQQSGNISSIVMRDINILEMFYAHTIRQHITAVFLPVTALIITAYFSIYISLAMIPFIIVLFFIPIINAKKSNQQGQALAEVTGKFNAQVVDGIQGLDDIISFRLQKAYLKNIFKINTIFNKSSLDYQIRSSNEGRLINLIIGLAGLTSKIIIILLILAGKIDIIWMLPLFIITALIYNPILEIMNVSRNFGMIFAASERVYNLFQMKSTVEDKGPLTEKEINKNNIEINFNSVYFKYPNITKTKNLELLKGVDFYFKTGETVALVGASGEGKTTIAKLCQRFWDIDKGEIKINNNNIKDFELHSLRSLITVVPQDIYLFNRSIKDNVKIAKINSTDDEILEALKKAQIENIPSANEGWNTIIGERGIKLSGGEKARLGIAQAFLKDSPVLILDEASANLDSENEEKINKAVKELKKGRAVLVIAHRLSTIRSADRIVLLHNGIIEEQGSYNELIERSQYFKELIGKEFF